MVLLSIPQPTFYICMYLYFNRFQFLDSKQTMEFMIDDNRIVYLFKLKSGTCKSSFAHLVAENVGIPEATINRSREVRIKRFLTIYHVELFD